MVTNSALVTFILGENILSSVPFIISISANAFIANIAHSEFVKSSKYLFDSLTDGVGYTVGSGEADDTAFGVDVGE